MTAFVIVPIFLPNASVNPVDAHDEASLLPKLCRACKGCGTRLRVPACNEHWREWRSRCIWVLEM